MQTALSHIEILSHVKDLGILDNAEILLFCVQMTCTRCRVRLR